MQAAVIVVAFVAGLIALVAAPAQAEPYGAPHITSITDPGLGNTLIVNWTHVYPSTDVYWNTGNTEGETAPVGSQPPYSNWDHPERGVPMICVQVLHQFDYYGPDSAPCTGYLDQADDSGTATISGLTPGVTYWFQVASYNSGDVGTSANGDYYSNSNALSLHKKKHHKKHKKKHKKHH